MMDILIVSNSDTCRSRMAQEILNSLGNGMKIYTAGVLAGNSIPNVACRVMERNGYSLSRKKPCDVGTYVRQPWDYVITLCQEAEVVEEEMGEHAKQSIHFHFDDPFRGRTIEESEQDQQVTALYDVMYRELYEFFRDELREQLLPRCICEANIYCRCE